MTCFLTIVIVLKFQYRPPLIYIYVCVCVFVCVCFPLGQGQECQDVAPFGNFFIQQGSSFCVNCPLTGSSIQWLIDNVPVNTNSPPLDHSIFSNNSLIMRSSKTGSYWCVNSALTTHQFTVVLASKV